jgi:hypothetical protein
MTIEEGDLVLTGHYEPLQKAEACPLNVFEIIQGRQLV